VQRERAGTAGEGAAHDGEGLAGEGPHIEGKVLIVEARYYEDVADLLAAGAIAELDARGVAYDRVTVPGALEIPQALAAAVPLFPDVYAGAIALGCVIRGETSHYDVVCHNANHWLMETAITSGISVGNAILTVDTKAQAIARATGGRAGKGGDAARACLALIALEHRFAGQMS
jgi:6,7-dimethyl-8-ribityllumazine synthase